LWCLDVVVRIPSLTPLEVQVTGCRGRMVPASAFHGPDHGQCGDRGQDADVEQARLGFPRLGVQQMPTGCRP